MSYKIYLDPGHNHSGGDTGAQGYGLKEQDVSVLIGQKVRNYLEKQGHQVKMSRYEVNDNIGNGTLSSSLSSRSSQANSWGADIFISIHCNAANSAAYGCETYAYTDGTRAANLAKKVQSQMVIETGRANRGFKTANFSVIKNTYMPAILVETAFIDNQRDNQYLASDQGKTAFAIAIYKGVCDYFGESYNALNDEPPIVDPPEHWCQGYMDYIETMKFIESPEEWDFNTPTPVSNFLALIDKVSGGTWTSEETDPSIHWCQPHVISLCGKGILTDKDYWISKLDDNISKGLVLAVVDNLKGGMLPTYKDRTDVDSVYRNHLDSLCDKAIIASPGEWEPDFDAEVYNANTIALVAKSIQYY